jgi:hypothetical protein
MQGPNPTAFRPISLHSITSIMSLCIFKLCHPSNIVAILKIPNAKKTSH